MDTMNVGYLARSDRAALVAGLLAVTLATLPGSALAAGTVPKSGDYHLRYTMVNVTTSAFGPTARGSDAAKGVTDAGDWISWAMSDDGNDGFGHKLTGDCSMVYKVNSTGIDAVEGDCVYADADGDKLFEVLHGAKASWTGGTGKYAGIMGDMDLTDIVVRSFNGYEMVAGVKVGSYTIK
jgi:hypothetical protein